jgi:carbamoyl-phosphate synthase large subunit
MALYERGLIGVPGTPEMIGANAEAIATAEDRDKFKQAMVEIGLAVRSAVSPIRSRRRRLSPRRRPARDQSVPAYILGGRGTGHRLDAQQSSRPRAIEGLAASPINEILIEKSIAGWKEYELEVMRDRPTTA